MTKLSMPDVDIDKLAPISQQIIKVLESQELSIVEIHFITSSVMGLIMQYTVTEFSKEKFGKIDVEKCMSLLTDVLEIQKLSVLETVRNGLEKEAMK